jgi:hypothetical protein
MNFLKKKLITQSNLILESRYFNNKFILNEESYFDLAKQKLQKNNFDLDINEYVKNNLDQNNFFCIPKKNNTEDNKILNDVVVWLDNNFDNKIILEIKLKELIKLFKVVEVSKDNENSLSEQFGSDSITFGNTVISKEKIEIIGKDLIFLVLMTLVGSKPKNNFKRKYCL